MTTTSNLEKQVIQCARTAIEKAITDAMTGYNSPMTKICQQVIDDNQTALYKLMNDEFSGLINSTDFKAKLKEALNAKLAKVIVGKLGGELESQVNKLKANPETRARITIAISKVIDDLA